ncbi:hypothetical protein [Arthrospiribacter ruber]|uniref:Uncharacterized protein n=1 Tax=Arthrospiribacter ruber TaxID=2487934 RepID=A0A951IT60_9BACT|nr:hypothetical protein [Arthrospiribacter ruber]MBW3466858.1 hypothetical protein [Arthrospiribacter ruber]
MSAYLATYRKTLKQHQEMAACMGKIKYPTEQIAWMVFYRYYFPFGKRGKSVRFKIDKLSCYKCRFCGFWHMGTPKRQSAARNKTAWD